MGTGSAVLGLMAWTIAVGGALAATVCYRQRFLALLLLGAVGLAVSLAFVLLSAPDLALTQLLVEIATIALIMVVLNFLPQSSPVEPGAWRKWRDAGVAIAAGLGITWIVHAVLTRPFDAISPFFLERALTEGGGTNVVNVILVDFRGYDTLGEVTVLGIAGLVVFALAARPAHRLRRAAVVGAADMESARRARGDPRAGAAGRDGRDLPLPARAQPARRRLHRRDSRSRARSSRCGSPAADGRSRVRIACRMRRGSPPACSWRG